MRKIGFFMVLLSFVAALSLSSCQQKAAEEKESTEEMAPAEDEAMPAEDEGTEEEVPAEEEGENM